MTKTAEMNDLSSQIFTDDLIHQLLMKSGTHPIYEWFNTPRTRRKCCYFAENIFKCIFFDENCCILIQISPKFVSQKSALVPNRRQASIWTNDGPVYRCTVETLYNTIYYSKYFIELNFDKSTQYVALWTHKRHPIPRPFGRAMECLLWVLQQKLTVL